MKTFKQLLVELCACREAREWAYDMTVEEVVEKCHKGDWLLWLAQKVGIGKRPLTLAIGHCSTLKLHIITDEKSKKTAEVAIAYGEGRATEEEFDIALNASNYSADENSYIAAHVFYTSEETQLQTADICRKYIGHLIIEKVNELLK